MTKELWIKVHKKIDPKLKQTIFKKCAELCDGTVISPEDVELAKKSGIQKTISTEGGDIQLLKASNLQDPSSLHNLIKERNVALQITIQNRDDEKNALTLAKKGVSYLIVECPNWKIIPLENLIAEAGKTETKLLAAVNDLQEAEVALETLEMGVHGVILEASNIPDINSATTIIKQNTMKISLVEAIVDAVTPLGKGARVCVDTCDILTQGEGCLVGSQSSGLFLIEAEVHENPHVEPRPFRVNAGPVSSYTLTPDGKTRYLNELVAGDKILIVDRKGNTKSSLIGRVKIEVRPMLLVEGSCDERRYKVILQNAETIRVVTSQGSISVSELQPGDKILIHQEEGGRHFGIAVPDEMIIER